jgi:hypothetical protein
MMTAMILQKLDAGYRCLYLNSPPMVAGVRSYLAAKGMDVVSEIAKARLVLSSEQTSPDRSFNVDRMLSRLEEALDNALIDGYKGLWATGDITWEFGPEKDFSRLLEYEWGLEELFRKRPELCGICQYHRDTLPHEAMRQGLQAHPAIFINETLSRINPHYAQSGLSAGQSKTNPVLDEMVNALCQLNDTGS